jgi:CBS domain-containing protein
MKEEAKDIIVEEVMSKDPRTGTADMTAQAAAKLMKKERVGSLVIVEDGSPVGIITEKDLMEKIVAEGKSAKTIKVKDLMSSPLVTIGPRATLEDAAKKMSTMRLRRLPVVSKGKLIGILTENDVLRLSPSLIEMTREWSKLGVRGMTGTNPTFSSGYCDNCGLYSNELIVREGELLCSDCYDQLRETDQT